MGRGNGNTIMNMTDKEIKDAIERGRRDAREYKKRQLEKDKNVDTSDGLNDNIEKNKEKDDFINNGPKKLDKPKRNDKLGNGGKEDKDGGNVKSGIVPVYKKVPIKQDSIEDCSDANAISDLFDESMPGVGEVSVDSLSGKEIYDNIYKSIQYANDNGEDIGITDITDTVPNNSVTEYQKRDIMRRLLQDGIDNKTLNGNKEVSVENPLSIDPTNYCAFSFLDWEKVMTDFLEKIDIRWEYDWYGSPYKHGDFDYSISWRRDRKYVDDGVSHIVICVDTSGSVSEEKISVFLSQIGDVLDSAINDEIIVDVVKCAYSNLTIDRFLHTSGEFAKEAKIIRNSGERGGTDYTNPLKYFHYMMMDDDDRMKNGFDEFMKDNIRGGIHVIDSDLSDIDSIPPASGFILFTDGDYFSCDKYYGTMEAESAPFEDFVNRTCFFIGIDSYDVRVGNVDVWGNPREADDIYRDRLHICSMESFWNNYIKRKTINESKFNMGFKRRNIAGFNISDEDDAVKKNGVGVDNKKQNDVDTDSIDDIVNKAKNKVKANYLDSNQSLIVALEISDVDYNITQSDGIVHITGGQELDHMKMKTLGGVHGDTQYTIDGPVYIIGDEYSFLLYHKPIKKSKGYFIFKDNKNITSEDYEKIIDNECGHLFKYVNCPKLTKYFIDIYTADGDEYAGYHAFSNDSNLIKEYVVRYIEQINKTKTRPNEYSLRVGSLYENNKNEVDMSTVRKLEPNEAVEKSSIICIDPVWRTVKDSVTIFCRQVGGANSQQTNANEYGYNYGGVPPFIVFCVSPECLFTLKKHPGNFEINNMIQTTSTLINKIVII